jgi:hypothetical protein
VAELDEWSMGYPVYLYLIYVGLLFFALWAFCVLEIEGRWPFRREPMNAPSVGSVTGAAVVFLFACFPYLLMIAVIDSMGCCDPAGGLFRHFGSIGLSDPTGLLPFIFTVVVLWILLGFLLIPPVKRRTSSGHAAWWESFGAFVLFPLSLFSIFFAIGLYARYHGWPIAVPILLPLLIGLYGIWVRFPAMHRADVTNAVFWGAIYVVALAPFPLYFLNAQPHPELFPDRTGDFRRLTPDSTLRDYLDFRPYEERREEWFEGVRRVKSRQTDAVKLMKEGRLSWVYPIKNGDLYDLWRFDLEATPSVCEAFHEELRNTVAFPHFIAVLPVVWRQLENIEWLTNAHCDLSDTLTDIETKVRALPPQPPAGMWAKQITAILNTLATLPQTH